MSHGKEKLVPTGGEQQPGASEKEGKNKTGQRTIINSRKIHTENPIFFFPVGGASSQCKVGRKKLMKEKKNKQKHSLFLSFSFSLAILGAP
jgi:hypothetical protein